MRYDLMRLILLLRDTDLFSPPSLLSREEWLRRVFGEEVVFDHYGSEFHYVPEVDAPARFIVGRIGRARPVVENEPPEEGMHEIERESWIAAGIIIDPTTHDDGQKVAIEDNPRVGRPASIFRSLVKRINQMPEQPYIIEPSPIVDPETFWEFERANRGEVTSITFDLFAPNMFGLRNEFDKELRELRDHEKAREVKLSLENKDGLQLETERVRATVDFTLERGGSIRARTKRKRRYNSKNKTRKITVEEATGSLLDRMGAAIVRLFA
jgi:hypothetical protein